jgi:hypothetical protein
MSATTLLSTGYQERSVEIVISVSVFEIHWNKSNIIVALIPGMIFPSQLWVLGTMNESIFIGTIVLELTIVHLGVGNLCRVTHKLSLKNVWRSMQPLSSGKSTPPTLTFTLWMLEF